MNIRMTLENSHNPFINQVSFFTTVSVNKWDRFVRRHNPFINQVSFFPRLRR